MQTHTQSNAPDDGASIARLDAAFSIRMGQVCNHNITSLPSANQWPSICCLGQDLRRCVDNQVCRALWEAAARDMGLLIWDGDGGGDGGGLAG